MKFISPLKFFGIILPVIGLFIFFSLQLTAPVQSTETEVSSPISNLRTNTTNAEKTAADPAPALNGSMIRLLPTPKVETITITSAGPTPIAVTGGDRVVAPTPTEMDVPEPAVEQASIDLPIPTRPVSDAYTYELTGQLPALETFVQQVTDGQAGVLRGVYVTGILALRVVQQPEGEVAFISEEDGTATQFQSASMYGVVGLLAHNFLSGGLFHHLKTDQEISLIYGDGRLENYRISRIDDYERLTLADLQSDFRSLATDQTRTVEEVFFDFYSGEPHLTLQTCIEKDGLWNWGVRFIVAKPID